MSLAYACATNLQARKTSAKPVSKLTIRAIEYLSGALETGEKFPLAHPPYTTGSFQDIGLPKDVQAFQPVIGKHRSFRLLALARPPASGKNKGKNG